MANEHAPVAVTSHHRAMQTTHKPARADEDVVTPSPGDADADARDHQGHAHGNDRGRSDGHGAGDEHEDEFRGLRHAFRERAIALRTMDRPLRLMTGLAIVQLVLAAILIPVRAFPLPQFPTYVVDEHLVQSPIPLYGAEIVLLALSWGYVLAGVLHAHPWLRVLGLAAVTWALTMVHPSTPPLGVAIAWDAMLAVPWLVGVASVLHDRGLPRRQTPLARGATGDALPWPLIVALPLSILVLYGLSYLGDRHLGSSLLFTTKVTVQLTSLQFVLIPILFLAGVDFAEWGQMSMARLAMTVRATRRPAHALAVSALGAVVILGIMGYEYRHTLFVSHHLWPLLGATALGLVTLGMVAALACAVRLTPGWPRHLPYRALVGMTLLFCVAAFGLSMAGTLTTTQRAINQIRAHPLALKTTTFTHGRWYPFTLAYPQPWALQTLDDAGPKQPLILLFNGLASGNPAVLYLVGAGKRDEPTFARARADWTQVAAKSYTFTYDHPQRIGPWQTVHYVQSRRTRVLLGGRMWYRQAGNLIYLLQDGTNRRFERLEAPLFAAVALSFSPTVAHGQQAAHAGPAPAQESGPTSADLLLARIAVLFAVVGLAGIVLLVRRGRRGQTGPVSAGLLFVAVFCLYGLTVALHSIAVSTMTPASPLGQIPIMGITGFQSAVALATLVGIIWACATRRVTARWGELALQALILNGALQVVSWVYDLLGAAMEVSSRLTIAGAVIIILALLWDVTMSGETVTNVDGALFPRRSRVLLFFGYMCFTATNLLYFSTLTVQATGAHVEAQFESDVWVQQGLLLLGVPLLLTLFLLQVGRRTQAAGGTATDSNAARSDGCPMRENDAAGPPSSTGAPYAPPQAPEQITASAAVHE